jgi:hypothetical protein
MAVIITLTLYHIAPSAARPMTGKRPLMTGKNQQKHLECGARACYHQSQP